MNRRRTEDGVPEQPSPPELVTAAEIARRAAVTRATVSNWRRRHPSFPHPVGGTSSSPAFDWEEVHSWLQAQEKLPQLSPTEELRQAIRPDFDRFAEALIKALPDLTTGQVSKRPNAEAWAQLQDEVGESVTRAFAAVIQALGPAEALNFLVGMVEADHLRPALTLPPAIAELMVRLTFIEEYQAPRTFLAPATSTGRLAEAAARLGATALYIQSDRKLLALQAESKARFARPDITVDARTGSGLLSDAFPGLLTDAVACVAPFGEDDWGYDELLGDPRWEFGEPPRKEPALAWVMHCLAHLTPRGIAAVLMPSTIATRARGVQIKAKLISSGALRAVISLPPWPGMTTGARGDLWILRSTRHHSADRVMFIDASGPADLSIGDKEYRRSHALLEPDSVRDLVLDIWTQAADDPGNLPERAQWVSVTELLETNAGLSPQRYVRPKPPEHDPDAFEALTRSLTARLAKSTRLLQGISRVDRMKASGIKRKEWRMVRVVDLVRSDAIELQSSGPSSSRQPGAAPLLLQEGDIVIPESMFGNTPEAVLVTGDLVGREAGPRRHVLRPDPKRFDSWFLLGFLNAATSESSIPSPSGMNNRMELRRLRVPLIPLAEQRRYGREFHRLALLKKTAQLTQRTAEVVSDTLGAGLTGGWLAPPGQDEFTPPPVDLD